MATSERLVERLREWADALVYDAYGEEHEIVKGMREAAAALSAAEARAWQAIETAPRYEAVLATVAGSGEVAVAINRAAGWVSIPGGWTVRPTHWMPLPAAPTSAAHTGEGGP